MNLRYPVLILLVLFLTTSLFSQNSFEIAIDHIKRTEKFESDDLADIIVTDQYQTKHNGLTHLYLRQRFDGLEIEGANVNYNILESGSISSFGGKFIKNLNQRITTKIPAISATQALQIVLSELEIDNSSPPMIVEIIGGKEQKVIFDKGDISLEDIPIRLVYVIDENENLRLSWEISIYERGRENMWMLFLDALNGQVLKKYNLVLDCHFESDFNHDGHHSFKNKESIISIKQNAAMVANSYRVYAFPVESPNHGGRSLQISPWTQAGLGGTLGWHDDGSVVSFYTKGNNVDAYEDNDDSDFPTNGDNSRAFGGVLHEFDYPLSLDVNPLTQKNPIITNLFYWNNILHDVIYQYGFDEPSGNFQEDNMGRGGSGGDYVNAEAQDNIDGPGNNANFYTPVDGQNPRMQMYLWDPIEDDSLRVNAPLNVEGKYILEKANFGDDLDIPITGNIVEVDDGSGNPTQGCNALINGGELFGNIALVDRGNCEYGTQCLNAQNAGAIAVIVCNNVPGNPLSMNPGNDGGQVAIPAVMIRQDDCAMIRAELDNGLNSTVSLSPYLDSDLDNGVIVHEYTHGISNRLTGGPNNVSCLNNAEQMGEGWSDFFAVWMTTQSNDQHDDPRGMGTYLLGEPTNGNGIRPTPYSTSFAINPSTYGDIHNNGLISQPHGIGYLWCTMIWDLNWALINAHGYSSNLYNSGGTAGNIVAMQLIVDGLKGQPCSPGFEDGRDAIIAADQNNNGGANTDIIWNVFARRGMGYSASQGSPFNRNDGSEAFDLPPGVPFLTEDELFENAPLPVELISFNAVANDRENQIDLFWNTASESNNKGFEIQRRADDQPTFETIGWVDGVGESLSLRNYEFIDKNVVPNISYYYQLKQIDFNEMASFSDVVTASLKGLEYEVAIYPNPTQDVVLIKLSEVFSGLVSMKIFDAKGQLLDQQMFNSRGNAELEINFAHQPDGVYFIQIEMENDTVTKRIIVKR